ncbi:hypothetical protein SAMN04488498_1383 [Mesorhizobium albiziae]|uniref:Uncharacterized protein n=1 Tax=Neomesorhizobium albiziae TaxID=335020 RepID=A0A1I4F5Y1_9HYPH|nr:hypothetical protein SAMN04488498_1383 [Mesorhizobium albiziae]
MLCISSTALRRVDSPETPPSRGGTLSRLTTEPAVDNERVATEQDGFSESVTFFLREQGWSPQQAHDGGAFGLDFAIEDPRMGFFGIGIECERPPPPDFGNG